MFSKSLKLLAASGLLSSVLAEPTRDQGQYHHHKLSSSPKKNYKSGGPITVHIAPHSHDDVGWLVTVEEYFKKVEVELTSIIHALLANPKRKFVEVEMKFFSMWWSHQNDEIKAKTKMLVKEGRLELINGGWSMHDEACPTYEDMINNMKIGHDFILENFNVKPRIGWQIDPFGHSNTNARIFAEMGFDAWFFARLDYADKEKRLNDQ